MLPASGAQNYSTSAGGTPPCLSLHGSVAPAAPSLVQWEPSFPSDLCPDLLRPVPGWRGDAWNLIPLGTC